jgi:hypothetical protein
MQVLPPWVFLGGVILLILLAIGIFIAIIVYFRQAQSDKQAATRALFQQQPQPPPSQPIAPQQETTAPATVAVPSPAVEAPASPGEVMRVIRDERTGRVLVQVEGKQYTHIHEITDARVGRRVLWAIADLVRFTGGMATNPQAVRSVAPKPAAADLTQFSEPAATSGSVLDRLAQPSASTPGPAPQMGETAPAAPAPATGPRARPSYRPSVPAMPEEKPRQGYSLVDYFRQGFERRGSAEPTPGPTSFIDEIEEILQLHISRLPSPLPVEVHVLTSEDGSLQIEVGLDVYDSADDVPDPQIRQLIQDAVSEWERS